MSAVFSAVHSMPVSAHTGFDRSEPADGDETSQSVDEVVITFTGPAEPTGEGFVALDPVRGVRAPDEVVARNDSEWVLRFDPPLSSGEVAVRWTVKAPDAHAISGGFSFTVITGAETGESESEPDSSVGIADHSGSELEAGNDSEAGNILAVVENQVENQSGSDSEAVAGQSASDPEAVDDFESETVSNEPSGGAGLQPVTPDAGTTIASQVVEPMDAADFVAEGTEQLENAELVADAGRALGNAGAVLAIGALIFAVFVLDRPGDIVAMARWAGTCGLVVVCGAVLETVAQTYIERSQWSVPSLLALAETELGYAVGLRVMAGALLWALPMPRLVRRHGVPPRPADHSNSQPAPQVVLASMSGGGSGSPLAVSAKPAVRERADAVVDGPADPAVAWRWGPAAAVALVASIMLAAAHIFDGHTLSNGNRIVMSLAAFAHVGAAAAWAGGVVALVLIVLRRRRRPPINAAELGARFSVVAATGLVVVGVVGVALTALIIDTPSQLWTTDWGQLLLVKVALVVVGAALGGYNHFVVLPHMGDPATAADAKPFSPRPGFPTVLAVEAALLILIAMLSGVLVGAAL